MKLVVITRYLLAMAVKSLRSETRSKFESCNEIIVGLWSKKGNDQYFELHDARALIYIFGTNACNNDCFSK